MSLKLIWEPLQIGSLRLKNRVARSANTTKAYPDRVSDELVAYHLARARGGVGLTILEAAAVHKSSILNYIVDDDAMRGYEKLMTAVRPNGMRVFQQLWHGGHNLPGVGGVMPFSSSATPSALTGIIGVPMGQAEIDEIVTSFAEAAKRCRDAGLDGVEIHGGHGYLIQQFLSPLTNRREDGYNGGLLDRARFLIEVLRATRAAVGPDFPVGVRMGSSTAKGGTSAADIAEVAAHLESLGLIDFLDITFSDYFMMPGMSHSMAYPSGYQLPINEVIAKSVKVPRLVTGRYRTLEEGEQVLRAGQADLVSFVRAMIADPELARKTAEGRVDDVRPCIACNQGCVGGLLQIGRMQCAVNPAAGYELSLDEHNFEKAAAAKKVFVVGGGPAGLEAARVAALRGHKVTLIEAQANLGGTLQTAKRAPHLAILGDITSWLERQVYELGVEVRLSNFAEPDEILRERPDALIIATGAESPGDGRQFAIPGECPAGMNLPHVFNQTSLFHARLPSLEGKTALVYDDVGRYDAIAAADFLAKAGATVTFATALPSFAPKMHGTMRDHESLSRLNRTGRFRLLVNYNLIAVEPEFAVVRALGAEGVERVSADVVVVVTNLVPVRGLYDALRDRFSQIHLVGNALSPRDILAAIHDGHRAARAL